MRAMLAGLMVAGLWGAAALGEEIGRPDWARRPSGETVGRYYPEEAMDRSISGEVTLVCTVIDGGRLDQCSVKSESPVGMGFGDAVVRMAEREFRMTTKDSQGRSTTGASVTVPLRMAAPSPGVNAVIFDAVWTSAPSFEDMVGAWPAAVGDLPVGTAVLRCRVLSDGGLRNCTIAGQTPKGAPFGEAARTLVGKFRLKGDAAELKKYTNADIAVSFRFYNPATPAGQAKKVEKPDWSVRIDPKKVVALFPEQAAAAGRTEGVGVVDCLVAGDGRLTDCRPFREEPADMGFGAAAVLAASVMQMDLWTQQGRPVAGARVKLPINFNLAPEPEEEAPPTP